MHILAQAGSFVPAEKAKLGLVHQIFTRFGSFDNVVLGKGTFLIEMEETCKILKTADEMSLVSSSTQKLRKNAAQESFELSTLSLISVLGSWTKIGFNG
jgi:hypothetical protein